MKTLLFILLTSIGFAQDYSERTKSQLLYAHYVQLNYSQVFDINTFPVLHIEFREQAAILLYLYNHYEPLGTPTQSKSVSGNSTAKPGSSPASSTAKRGQRQNVHGTKAPAGRPYKRGER